MKNEANNQFLIALDGIELTEKQIANIQTGIQSIVMSELAKMDNLDGYSVEKKKFDSQTSIRPPGMIWGQWGTKLEKVLIFQKNVRESQ